MEATRGGGASDPLRPTFPNPQTPNPAPRARAEGSGMADDAQARLLLIVTGSLLRAEEADRPLAYYLKREIESRLAEQDPGLSPLKVQVVADFRWIHEDALHPLPTISLGGPGVNALAQQWLDELPLSLKVDDHYFIQMDPDLDEPRVSIWGMDNADTQIAVAAFIQRYLPRFLDHCLAHAPGLDLGLVDDEEDEDLDDED
jgi:hypothetical protein